MLCEYLKVKEKLEETKTEIKLHKKDSNDWFDVFWRGIDLLNLMEKIRHEDQKEIWN